MSLDLKAAFRKTDPCPPFLQVRMFSFGMFSLICTPLPFSTGQIGSHDEYIKRPVRKQRGIFDL